MSVPGTRYSLSLRVIHWLTVVAIVAAYMLAEGDEGHGEAEDAAAGIGAMSWHYLAGASVLALVIIRLTLRVFSRTPPILPPPGALTAITGRLVQASLYAFLVIEPLLGWLQVNYGGGQVTLPWHGWYLPALVHADPQAKEWAGELHEALGEIFYWIIGLHVLAALWHHFVRKDNTLRRMI